MPLSEKIEPRCAYCRWAAPLEGEEMICEKKGVVPAAGHCFRFRYDPLRRIPPRPPEPPDFSRFDGEDFSL